MSATGTAIWTKGAGTRRTSAPTGRRYGMGADGIDRAPNDLLYNARVRQPSPSGSGRPMSRQELADEVNAYLYGRDRRSVASGVDAKYIGKLERGKYRWPNELYRQAFRH